MLHGPKPTQTTARKLRRKMTSPEILLWQELRKRPSGLKFRHQHPAGPYILDFFCAARKLAIEVDGEVHSRSDQPERDAARDAFIATQGVRTLRIPAADILKDLGAVITHILAEAGA